MCAIFFVYLHFGPLLLTSSGCFVGAEAKTFVDLNPDLCVFVLLHEAEAEAAVAAVVEALALA